MCLERPLVGLDRAVHLITELGRFLPLTSFQSPSRLACFSPPHTCSLAPWRFVSLSVSSSLLCDLVSSLPCRQESFLLFAPPCVYCCSSTMFSMCVLCLWLCVCAHNVSILCTCVHRTQRSVSATFFNLSHLIS